MCVCVCPALYMPFMGKEIRRREEVCVCPPFAALVDAVSLGEGLAVFVNRVVCEVHERLTQVAQ